MDKNQSIKLFSTFFESCEICFQPKDVTSRILHIQFRVLTYTYIVINIRLFFMDAYFKYIKNKSHVPPRWPSRTPRGPRTPI